MIGRTSGFKKKKNNKEKATTTRREDNHFVDDDDLRQGTLQEDLEQLSAVLTVLEMHDETGGKKTIGVWR